MQNKCNYLPNKEKRLTFKSFIKIIGKNDGLMEIKAYLCSQISLKTITLHVEII